MISVIISTHNRLDRLEKAIKSVLDQTYQDFEIVVVDDASTDGTKQAMESLSEEDKRIKYIRREENYGNDTKPKNQGVLASKGEYISFLDDDNLYRPEHLSVLLNEMEKGGFDVVYGDRWIIDETGKMQPQVGVYSDFNFEMLFQRNYIDTSDVLVKRQTLFDVGGFDERYKKYVDWNLWLRMAKYGHKFKRVPLIITDYYLNETSKSLRAEDERDKMLPAWDAVELEVELPYLGEKTTPKVAVFTLTYDRVDLTKECFETLYETAGYEFDHYIWDNGSKDGTVEYLEGLKPHGYCKNVKVIYSQDNKGISIASNGLIDEIKKGDYRIILKSDNDAYYKTPDWLKKMVEIWSKNHLLVLSCYVEGLRDHPGGAQREARGMIAGEVLGMTRHVGGICHFVDARGYDGFRWDEDSALHGVQDLELSQYLWNKGYGMGYLENFFVEHRLTTEGQHKKYPDYFERRKEEKTHSYKESKDEKNIK